MQSNFLLTAIEYLKGVGPKRAEFLKKDVGVFRYVDLLNYFPFRYVDRTQYFPISKINDEITYIQIKGALSFIKELGEGRKKRLSAKITDESGEIELVWFKGIKWIKPNLHPGKEYIVYGRPTLFQNKYNMAHPDIEIFDPSQTFQGKFQPIYHSSERLSQGGLNSKGFEKIITAFLPQALQHIEENLSKNIVEKYHLVGRKKAYHDIHIPQTISESQAAIKRLKFEELFFLQMRLLKQKQITERKIRGHYFQKIGSHFNTFYEKKLPFELTNAQKRVLKEIRQDTVSGKQMNRLLQGDVGSGKTLVALLAALTAIDNGFQACIMAPTEILAQQHFHTLKEFLEDTDTTIDLLTGSTKKKVRESIHTKLENGETNILIGTHALIEDVVQFQNLGLAIIDEQHRFGVSQRSKLWRKNTTPPHMLVMTATPIPRTLAMTLYGDLDVSIIDELPPGRKMVKTIHKYDSARLNVFGFIEKEIEKGRQIYIVYPLIEESEKMKYKDLTDGFESISRRFPLPKYRVGVMHGRMKPEEKDFEMQQFAKSKTHILVSTTVIEVGVNVPNASVMIIENAERFGLSQLHQLRGRVGRGAEQSYCVLMTDYKLTSDGKKRIETMVKTNDGFELSEVDLRLRGPGDIMGTQQSGLLNLNISDLAKDNQLVILAREAAINLLKDDPEIEKSENAFIRKELIKQMKSLPNWSRIS